MNKQDIAEIAELLVKAYEKNLYGERRDSFDAIAESVVEKIESLEKENAELKARLEKAVELPVKSGDKVWAILWSCRANDWVLRELTIADKNVDFYIKEMMVNVQLSDFNKEWFTSKEQAEKRYKELKEKGE